MKKYLQGTTIDFHEAMYLVQVMNDYADAKYMVDEEERKLSSQNNSFIQWGNSCNECDVRSYMKEFENINYWEFLNISTDLFPVGNIVRGRLPEGLEYEISVMDDGFVDFSKIRCYKTCSFDGHLLVFFGMTDESYDVLKTIYAY